MSVRISPNLPANVVEIGNEITQAKINEINSGTLATQSWVGGSYLSKSGGDLNINSYLTQNNGFNYSTLNGESGLVASVIGSPSVYSQLHKDFITVQTYGSNVTLSSTGITFPDASVQTTAYTGGGGGSGTLTYSSPYIYDNAGAVNITDLNLGAGELTAGAVFASANCSLDSTGLAFTASSGANITFADATVQSTAYTGATNGVDIQTFGSSSTSGTFTWTKPTGAKWVDILLFGGGGGGGSGARQATTINRGGGAGGTAGSFIYQRINASFLGSTESVVIGAGGAGGAGKTTDTTSGVIGTSGGNTTFNIFRSGNGLYGNAGTATSGGAGTAVYQSLLFNYSLASLSSGTGNLTTGSNATSSTTGQFIQPTCGGGGAGAGASVTTSWAGGLGGSMSVAAFGASISTAIAGGSGGTTAGVAATAGTSATTQYMQGGTGGGGGAYRTGFAGGTGANGGWPSGGGGGGGASDNGFTSGAGGAGANGFAVIVTYY